MVEKGEDMNPLGSKRQLKEGKSPGSILFVGEKKQEEILVTHTVFSAEELATSPSLAAPDLEGNHWIDCCGLHDSQFMTQLSHSHNIPLLAMEDIVNTDHRPKIEMDENTLLILFKTCHWTEDETIQWEHLAFFLEGNQLISFREHEGKGLDQIWQRLRNSQGRMRKRSVDYFLSTLLDLFVDRMYPVFDAVSDRVSALEDEVMAAPKPEHLHEIHFLKKELLFTQKTLWTLREITAKCSKQEFGPIQEENLAFFRDVHDHVLQINEMVESQLSYLASLMDLFMSASSQKMNEIMKVLTLMASIFIPITFIAGVYGMNFTNMPELDWPYGYLMAWVLMGGSVIGLLIYFKRKGWF